MRGSFDGIPCDKNHYQPFKYSSSHGDSCVFLKSACNEEGQIESTDRWPTTSDRTCRCDYRFGYNFVSQPNKHCVCVPSEEDCSCYFKECDKDQVLTPGKYEPVRFCLQQIMVLKRCCGLISCMFNEEVFLDMKQLLAITNTLHLDSNG